MKFLNEVRKEDDLYYCGPFWIIGNSVKDIFKGNFNIIGEKIAVNFKGDYLDSTLKRKGSTSHSALWQKYEKDFGNKSYTYFPRGRVRLYDGEVYIHINSKMNTPKVIDAIIKFYNLQKFSQENINIEHDDELQGSHYNFELK